jgi:peptidoglycan hydrolase-like protein with peptidoglycan-binding domain
VRELQLILTDLGYFDTKDTAIYGTVTQTSILDLQIKTGVVNNSDDL